MDQIAQILMTKTTVKKEHKNLSYFNSLSLSGRITERKEKVASFTTGATQDILRR